MQPLQPRQGWVPGLLVIFDQSFIRAGPTYQNNRFLGLDKPENSLKRWESE